MRQSPSILVIENDPNIAGVMADILCDEGYTVVCSYDRATTHACLEQHRLALVFLDAWLPQFNACALHALMQQHQTYSPVVITTTTSTTHSNLPSLLKPFTIDGLLSCVAGHVEQPSLPFIWN